MRYVFGLLLVLATLGCSDASPYCDDMGPACASGCAALCVPPGVTCPNEEVGSCVYEDGTSAAADVSFASCNGDGEIVCSRWVTNPEYVAICACN